MPGPIPKSAKTRQRRNRVSTAATRTAPAWEVPDLPALGGRAQWHELTQAQWDAMRTGPFADEYLPQDFGSMVRLARLWDAANKLRKPEGLAKLMGEIRLQEARFGCSPTDRRRLQWEVERGEEAEERTRTRRQRKTAAEAVEEDPLNFLKAVK